MADTYYVGLRATDDVVTNERPESWRAGILRLFPNGMAPLTGLTALMKSEKVTDPHYHWWTKTLTTQRAAITGLYSDASLSTTYLTTYATGASAGDTVFLKMTEANSKMFRVGHQVLIRDASNYLLDTVGKVTNVVANGASSNIAVRLLEDDDNDSDNSNYLGTAASPADVVLIVGNMNAQGATRPEAITQSPTEFENYTQIFRNSLDLARTLMETKLRTADAYTEAKRDALEQHSIEMEKAFFFSILTSSGTGTNGKPEYSTRGLLSWIRSYGTVADYTLEAGAAYAGKTWLQAGEMWFDEHMEEIFRYGSAERLGFCGSGALLGIQRLAKDRGFTSLEPSTTVWGTNVRKWTTPFGTLTLQTHPLFSSEATMRNSIIVVEPRNIRYRYVTDTMFTPDTAYGKGGGTGYDGKVEEYLTECGLEIHFPETTAYLNGVGEDNT